MSQTSLDHARAGAGVIIAAGTHYISQVGSGGDQLAKRWLEEGLPISELGSDCVVRDVITCVLV